MSDYFTVPNPMLNAQRAILEADRLVAAGVVPIVPHLSVLWEAVSPARKTHDEWLDLDFNYLLRCDALVRLSGESKGADREVAFAQAHDIPFCFGVDAFLAAKGGPQTSKGWPSARGSSASRCS